MQRERGFVSFDPQSSETRLSAGYDATMDLIFNIARPKRDCNGGFGFCDVHILEANDKLTRSRNLNIGKYECATTCLLDSTGEGIVYLLLANAPKSQGLTPENMPPFCVDDEIEQPMEENPKSSLFVIQGEYPFQQSLGKYGGYTVKVKYNVNE